MGLTKEQIDALRSVAKEMKWQQFIDTIDALESSLTEAHAESAAVLEKAAEYIATHDLWKHHYTTCREDVLSAIRTLIPLPAAAALAEVKRKEWLEARIQCLRECSCQECLDVLPLAMNDLRAEQGAKQP